MNALVDALWEVTWQGSLLAFAVFLFRAVLREKIAYRSVYLAWCFVCLRWLLLVVPTVSLGALDAVVPSFQGAFPMPLDRESVSVVTGIEESEHNVELWRTIAVSLWVTGALITAVVTSIPSVRAYRIAKRAKNMGSEPLLTIAKEAHRSIGLFASVPIRLSAEVKSPQVVGYVRPVLLLPHDFVKIFTPDQARIVLLHELAHVGRNDLLTGLLPWLVCVVHWFNPLAWWIARRMSDVRELACDEAVMVRLAQKQRHVYASTLLDVARRALTSRTLGIALVGNRTGLLRQRIDALLKAPARVRWATVLLYVLLVAIAVPFTQQTSFARPAKINAIPIKWFMSGGGKADYKTTFLSHPDGEGSAVRLEPRVDNPRGYGTFMRTFAAREHIGKHVELSLQFRSKDVTKRGDIWARVQARDSPPDGPGLGGDGCKVSMTHAWNTCVLRLRVPKGAHRVELGVGLHGPGTIWFRDLRVTVLEVKP